MSVENLEIMKKVMHAPDPFGVSAAMEFGNNGAEYLRVNGCHNNGQNVDKKYFMVTMMHAPDPFGVTTASEFGNNGAVNQNKDFYNLIVNQKFNDEVLKSYPSSLLQDPIIERDYTNRF